MNKDVQSLLEKATAVRLNAYAPYSNFLVGACIETSNGKFFSACNVENASYGLGICAESNAIGAMLAASENTIKQVVVVVKGPGVSAPCGACRQRLNEFASPDTPIHLFDLEGNTATYTLGDLLPHSFGPNDLLPPECS
jgi:cytidine deaminase